MKRPHNAIGVWSLPRAAVGVVVATLAVVLLAGTSSAQEDPYNPGPPGISVEDPSVCEGETVSTSVSDGTPGDSVTVAFAGQSTTLVLDSNGNASIAFGTAGVAPGTYQVTVETSSGASSSAPVFVLGDECDEGPPPTTPTLSVDGSDVCAGETVVATVTGAGAGEDVTLSVAGQSSTATADANGHVQAAIPTPGADPGAHALLATSASGQGASTQISLLAESAEDCAGADILGSGARSQPERPSSSGSLAFTGASIGGAVILGAALLLIGLVFVRRSRRPVSS